MTLILAQRLSFNEAEPTIYLYDYRVSDKDGSDTIHGDSIFKWQFFDDRIAFVTAGQVGFWSHAREYIEKRINEIHIENILEVGGPFHDAVMQAAWSYDSPTDKAEKFGALGFIIDIKNNKNSQFAIEGETGKGATIRETAVLEISGSGRTIPKLKEIILKTIETLGNSHLYDIYEIACAIRSTILSIIESGDIDDFKALGISPIMGLGFLDEAYFELIGEENEGIKYEKRNSKDTGYSIHKNDAGELIIEDKTNCKTQTLSTLETYIKKKIGNKLDPELRTKKDNT